MYKINIENRIILGLLIIICISLISNIHISFLYAQTNGESLEINNKFEIREFAEDSGQI